MERAPREQATKDTGKAVEDIEHSALGGFPCDSPDLDVGHVTWARGVHEPASMRPVPRPSLLLSGGRRLPGLGHGDCPRALCPGAQAGCHTRLPTGEHTFEAPDLHGFV